MIMRKIKISDIPVLYKRDLDKAAWMRRRIG